MKKILKVLGIIVVAFIVLGVVFGSGGSKKEQKVGEVSQNESSSNESATDESKEEIEVKEFYNVGDILEEGNQRIVYVASGDYIEENEYSQPAEGNKYIFFKFSFENISSNSDTAISFYDFECYADGYVTEMHYNDDESLSSTLSPGRSTQGTLIFEVPETASDIELEYNSNYWTDDKIKFVYEDNKDSGYVIEKNTTRSESALSVGQFIETDSLKISYLSCEDFNSDNMFVQPREGYHYVTCSFEFENIDSSDHSISSFSFDCFADGIDCKQTFIRDDDLSATISAGRKANGTVTFEVPNDAEVIELEFNDNVWTSSRIVFTIK